MGTRTIQAGLSEAGRRRLRFGEFVLDLDRASLSRGAEERRLRPKSFEVLRCLAEHPRRVVAKQELMSAAWPDAFVTDNTLVRCLQDIRRALDDHEQELVKTVARRGYLFETDVLAEPACGVVAMPAPALAEVARAAVKDLEPLAAALPSHRHRMILALAAVLAVTGIGTGIYRIVQPERIETVAVLPFQGVGDANHDEYLELGLADALINRLSTLKHLTVRATGSVRQFMGGSNPTEAGRMLRAGAVVDGTVQRRGDRVRISVRMTRVADGKAIWAASFDQRFEDIFALEDSVSAQIATALSSALSGEDQERWRKQYASNTEAYQLYMRGRFFWAQRTSDGLQKSVSYFEQAIQKDPRYAQAYAGVANSYGPMLQSGYVRVPDGLPKMAAAAATALELDPGLADAHTAMAATRFNEWNFPGAERESRIAIALNPSDPLAHAWYGYYVSSVGRNREWLDDVQRASQLDPLSVGYAINVANALSSLGRNEEAIAHLQKALELDPKSQIAHGSMAVNHEALHQYPQAAAEASQSENDLAVARIQAEAGKSQEARTILRRYLDRDPAGLPTSGIDIAAVYTALGEREEALRWLDRAYIEHVPKLMFLRVDPRLAALRADSRFGPIRASPIS